MDAYIQLANGMKYPTEQFNRDMTELEYLAIERRGDFHSLVRASRSGSKFVPHDLAQVVSSFGWIEEKRLKDGICGLIDLVAAASETGLWLRSPFAHVHPETRMSPPPTSPAICKTVTFSVHG